MRRSVHGSIIALFAILLVVSTVRAADGEITVTDDAGVMVQSGDWSSLFPGMCWDPSDTTQGCLRAAVNSWLACIDSCSGVCPSSTPPSETPECMTPCTDECAEVTVESCFSSIATARTAGCSPSGLNFQKFDPSKGTLYRAVVTVESKVDLYAGYETASSWVFHGESWVKLTAVKLSFQIGINSQNATDGFLSVMPVENFSFLETGGYANFTGFDGVMDFGGTSGGSFTWNFAGTSTEVTSPGDLAVSEFVGVGPLLSRVAWRNVDYSAMMGGSSYGAVTNLTPSYRVTVTYYYNSNSQKIPVLFQ